MLSKGADSVMEKLLAAGDQESERRLKLTKTYLDEYATEGLRTLLLTRKVIDEGYYTNWN